MKNHVNRIASSADPTRRLLGHVLERTTDPDVSNYHHGGKPELWFMRIEAAFRPPGCA